MSAVAAAPFRGLTALWIQVTGTWCNLRCTHCLNASGPDAPWLPVMTRDAIVRHLTDAWRLAVKEIYLTGGEPFLHPDILGLIRLALAHAPTTVLTNGTRISDEVADALAALAEGSRYSLELRVSLDDPESAANDRVRGRGAHARALGAIARLASRGLLPILTAAEVEPGERYERFRRLLLATGVAKPRVKLLPVFPVGRAADPRAPRPSAESLAEFDLARLQCAESRAVTATGVYACPILAGLPEGWLADDLAASFVPSRLAHPACVTCCETGSTCRNA